MYVLYIYICTVYVCVYLFLSTPLKWPAQNSFLFLSISLSIFFSPPPPLSSLSYHPPSLPHSISPSRLPHSYALASVNNLILTVDGLHLQYRNSLGVIYKPLTTRDQFPCIDCIGSIFRAVFITYKSMPVNIQEYWYLQPLRKVHQIILIPRAV